jgi:hypothetical protein
MIFKNGFWGFRAEREPSDKLSQLIHYRDSLREILRLNPESDEYQTLIKNYFDQAERNPQDTYADDLHHFADLYGHKKDKETILEELEGVNEELHELDPHQFPLIDQGTDTLALDDHHQVEIGDGGTLYPVYTRRISEPIHDPGNGDQGRMYTYPDEPSDDHTNTIVDPKSLGELQVSFEKETSTIINESFDTLDIGTINKLLTQIEGLIARCPNQELRHKLEQHRNRIVMYRFVLRQYLDTLNQGQQHLSSPKRKNPISSSSRLQTLLKLLSDREAKNIDFINLINKLITEADRELKTNTSPDIKSRINHELGIYYKLADARQKRTSK